jgi:hypothetical protein
MSEAPSPEETATWQRRLASQANNRAWSLSEANLRTTDEDEEMLQAAHAAMHLWKIVGTKNNIAHAAQLLAHAYAKLNLPGPAKHYLAKSEPVFYSAQSEPWEVALAHAVAASVASAAGDQVAHRDYYQKAAELIAALPDPEDRSIIEATFRVLPVPQA